MSQPQALHQPEQQWENVAFWFLLGLHLLPLWSHRYFLTADGPAHLYNAWLLKHLALHSGGLAHQLLAFNFNPEPNYLSHLLLGGLLFITPPWLADKLVLTLYMAGLPLALRYLLRAIEPGSGWLVVLGFPFVYSVVLVWGFYNFCLSLVVLLWVVGYWLRHASQLGRPGRLGTLMGLLALLFAAHPLSYLVSGLLLGLLTLAALGPQRQWWAAPRQLVRLLLAYLPTLPLLGWYFWQKGTATSQPVQDYATNLWSWVRLEPIHYFSSAEGSYRWLVAALLGAALGAAGVRLWRGAAGWPVLPWVVATLLLLSAYVALPDTISGGSIIRPRWWLFSYLALLSGLAAVPWPRTWRLAGLAAGTLVAGLLLGFRWQKFQVFQVGLAEYRSVLPYLRPGTTLLPLSYADVTQLPDGNDLGTYIPLFAHAANNLAVEAHLLCYENYEADAGYFPLVWQPGKAPLTDFTQRPAQMTPVLSSPAYVPTYVLLWGRSAAAPTSPANAARAARYLTLHAYLLRYRSPGGLLELYEQPVPIAHP